MSYANPVTAINIARTSITNAMNALSNIDGLDDDTDEILGSFVVGLAEINDQLLGEIYDIEQAEKMDRGEPSTASTYDT